MGERVGHDVALCLFLEVVVTDCGRRSQCRFHVTFLEDLLARLGVMGPDSRQEIRLQLEPDRELIRLGFARALLRCVDFRADPELILDVMSDLVGDHVGLGEVAWSLESLL